MNTNEILKADVIDIIFDNRNKKYGAYVLRKEYDKRMIIALLSSIGLFFLAGMLTFLQKKETGGGDVFPPPVVLTTVSFPEKDPMPAKAEPARVQQPPEKVMQRRLVNKIVIVPCSKATPADFPPIDQLQKAAISTNNVEGSAPATNIFPVVHQGTGNDTGTGKTAIIDPPKAPVDFMAVEVQPEFPGGKEAFIRFLNNYLVTPSGLEPGEKKVVIIRFVIDEKGVVTGFEVLNSAGAAFDNEVLRVLKKMPQWKPAIQNGRHVPVTFRQPVTFVGMEE